MYGGSYLGFSQWAAAKKLHPALKTIVPQVAAAPGVDSSMPFGMHRADMGLLPWLNDVTRGKLFDMEDLDNSAHWDTVRRKWFLSGKAYNSLDTVEGHPSVIFQRFLKHPSYDKYWQNMIPYKQEFSKINIPVLSITGYFDGNQQGALYYFNQLNQWNPKANSYLVIGPYSHFGAQGHPKDEVMGYHIEEAAKVDIDQVVFDWFDHILKGGPIPAFLKDKVNYQIMGTNTWGHVATLKQMNNDTLRFYLSNAPRGKYHQLTKRATTGVVEQQLDMMVRKIENAPEKEDSTQAVLDQDSNPVFVSDVINYDFTINGSFTANLFASITKKDMDVAVDVLVLQPDGKYIDLAVALIRASYAKDRTKRTLFVRGKKTPIYLSGWFISKKISKGSRLIVKVGPVFDSHFEVNYGTGKDVATETIADAKEPLRIKWYGNSLIQIPINTHVPAAQ